jgi:hypothetical protein
MHRLGHFHCLLLVIVHFDEKFLFSFLLLVIGHCILILQCTKEIVSIQRLASSCNKSPSVTAQVHGEKFAMSLEKFDYSSNFVAWAWDLSIDFLIDLWHSTRRFD